MGGAGNSLSNFLDLSQFLKGEYLTDSQLKIKKGKILTNTECIIMYLNNAILVMLQYKPHLPISSNIDTSHN